MTLTAKQFAEKANIPLKEAKAIIKHLKDPKVKAELKAFQEFDMSPASRTVVYENCLFLMRDPPAGMWADGSPMRLPRSKETT